MELRKEETRSNNMSSNGNDGSLNLTTRTLSPCITRMLTPTLSDDKTEDISLDFSKFETDTMLHSSYNPDRDIDRSPDPTCIQLQSPSPLDLSITTSFENSLSECGVTCFDSEAPTKSSYSFSHHVSSTESDSFVHIDEALPIDTLPKSQPVLTTPHTANLISSPPVILGSLGAANFVTAVLNKNMQTAQMVNNMFVPTPSLPAVSSPSILVFNPCGLVNLMPPASNVLPQSTTSILNMCPQPIKSIISLLTTKPQSVTRNSFISLGPEGLSVPTNNLETFPQPDPDLEPVKQTENAQVDQSQNLLEPIALDLRNEIQIADNTQEKPLMKNSKLDCQTNSTITEKIGMAVTDIIDIKPLESETDTETAMLNSENDCDEVDGDLSAADDHRVDSEASGKRKANCDIVVKDSWSTCDSENISRVIDTTLKNLDNANSGVGLNIASSKSSAASSSVNTENQSAAKKKRKQYSSKRQPRVKRDVILKCDLCSASFTKSGNYYRHRKIHAINTEAEDTRYACTHCDRRFLQKCDMKRHQLIHMNQEPFRCDVCQKGYIRKSDLKVHMRFHTRERSHPCDKCDKKFFQSGDLNRHKRQVHNESTALTCGHCKKSYATENTLIRHMQSSHRELILQSLNERYKGTTELNMSPNKETLTSNKETLQPP